LVISWGLEIPPPPLCSKFTDIVDNFTSIDISLDFGLVKVIIMVLGLARWQRTDRGRLWDCLKPAPLHEMVAL